MTKDELVGEVKKIMGHFRDGANQAAYEGFEQLLQRPGFTQLRPEDQRPALRLLIAGKRPELAMQRELDLSKPLDAAVERSHRAALPTLTELVSVHGEPEDFELLGMVHQRLGNLESASSIYRAGLQIERERWPGSDLCGALMSRLSSI